MHQIFHLATCESEDTHSIVSRAGARRGVSSGDEAMRQKFFAPSNVAVPGCQSARHRPESLNLAGHHT